MDSKRKFLFIWLILIIAFRILHSQPTAPTALLCENKTNPLYVEDPTPDFSWSASTQAYYQILVSTSQNNLNSDIGEMWDSGKVYSDIQSSIYSGSSLNGNSTYYWKVRVWDINNDTSPWSNVASFRMNFFLIKNFFTGLAQTKVFGFGDLDNDNDFDLIEGAYGDKIDLKTYLNDGSGNFSVTFSTYDQIYVYSLSLSDFNLDGNLDFFSGITEGPTTKNCLALKGKGDGSFSVLYDQFSKQLTRSCAIGDLNSDGNMDIVAGVDGGKNLYYLGNGDGTFSAANNISSESESTQSIALGDLDNDGDLDIVTANYSYDQAYRDALEPIDVYLNNGSGNFVRHTYSSNDYFNSVTLGDVDNDGDLDIIAGVKFVTGGDDTANRVYLNDGNANFGIGGTPFSPNYSFGKRTELGSPDQYPQVENLVFADFDNDGDGDVLLCNSAGERTQIELYLNDGTGNFKFLDEYDFQSNAISVFDVDGDSDLDFVASGEADEVRIYESRLSQNGNPNNLPSSPLTSNLTYYWNYPSNDKLTLKWRNGWDVETSSNQLSYNIRLGTSKNGNDASEDVISGKISQIQSESSLFIGNMYYSTAVVLNIPRKTYFFQVQTIDLQKGVSPWSEVLIINKEAHAGWDEEDVLISTTCHQYEYNEVKSDPNYPSLRGKVKISFKIRDYETNTCTLTDFNYSYDGGNSWNSLSNDSTALEYFKSNFNSSTDFNGTIHNFYWETTNLDNVPVIRTISTETVKIKFRVFDGYTTGPYVISENFVIDNERPTAPGDLIFNGVSTKNSLTLFFSTPTYDSNFYQYTLYYNLTSTVGEFDYDGFINKDDDSNLGYMDFNGVSSTTINGLNENTTYYIRLYVYDSYANSNFSNVISAKTNDAPSMDSFSVSQRSNGTGLVDISYLGYDVDKDSWSYISYEFRFSGTTNWIAITPKTDDNLYTKNLNFSSTGYFNNFVWDSKKDIDNIESQLNVKITISDSKDTDTEYTGNFYVDNLAPQGIGNLTVSKAYSSRVELQWNKATDFSNFVYEIWYSTLANIVRDTSTYKMWTEMSPTGEDVENTWVGSDTEPLEAGKTYYFKVYAVDNFGNISETNEVNQLTGTGPEAYIYNVTCLNDGTGKVKITFGANSPDKFDTFVKISYSTISNSGPWYSLSISTTDFEFYVSSGTGYLSISPPEISNSTEFQIGSLTTPVPTSSGTIKGIVYGLSKDDIPKYSGNLYIKLDIKDVYNVFDSNPPVDGPIEIDNLSPEILSAEYRHGDYNDYTYGNSGKLILNFSERISTESVSFSDMYLTPDLNEKIVLTYSESYNLGNSTSSLCFYLNEENWEKIARWDGEGKNLFLYISTGAIKDLSYNVIDETTTQITWYKDTISPYINDATYISEGAPRLTISFNEKILEDSINLNSIKAITLIKEKKEPTDSIKLDFITTIETTTLKNYIFYFPDDKHAELISWETNEFYIVVNSTFCKDLSGNYNNLVSTSDAIKVTFLKDIVPPSIVNFVPQSTSPVKSDSVIIKVYFDDTLKEESISNSINLYPYMDSSGNLISGIKISGSLKYYSTEKMIEFIPITNLEDGYTYMVEVSTSITDLSGNHLKDENRIWYFGTYRDFSKKNVVFNSSKTVEVIISSSALSGVGNVVINDAKNDLKVMDANSKEPEIENLHYPLTGYIVEINVYDEKGDKRDKQFMDKTTQFKSLS